MSELLEPIYAWHCFHYLEWTTIAQIWDNSGVTHDVVPDFLMTIIAASTGIGYGTERFEQLMNTYGWTLEQTPVPPPLDWIWFTDDQIWFDVGEQYESEGDANWDLCRIFNGAWSQGAGWPTRWP